MCIRDRYGVDRDDVVDPARQASLRIVAARVPRPVVVEPHHGEARGGEAVAQHTHETVSADGFLPERIAQEHAVLPGRGTAGGLEHGEELPGRFAKPQRDHRHVALMNRYGESRTRGSGRATGRDGRESGLSLIHI